MSTMRAADGQTWVNRLQVGWTTFAEGRDVYRDAWRDFVGRLEVLFPQVGLELEPLELTWSQPPKQPRGVRWSIANLARVNGLLDAGELISVGSTYNFAGRQVSPSMVTAVHVMANGFLPDQGAQVGVSVDTFSLSSHEEDAIADAFASWLPDVAERTSAVWAFVTSDPHWFPTIETPYERYYRLPEYGRPLARKHPRGYYWANLLGAEQVAGLGGLDAVVERASLAGLIAQPVAADLTIRIPSSITSYTDGELRAVKNLLGPVLLEGPANEGANPSRILVDQ